MTLFHGGSFLGNDMLTPRPLQKYKFIKVAKLNF